MPKVSGLIVPKLCHRCHDGNIRCLEPVAPSAHHHDYGRCEYEEAQNKEEPEEPLGIVTEITAIILLVSFLSFFCSLMNMLLTSQISSCILSSIHLCSWSNFGHMFNILEHIEPSS